MREERYHHSYRDPDGSLWYMYEVIDQMPTPGRQRWVARAADACAYDGTSGRCFANDCPGIVPCPQSKPRGAAASNAPNLLRQVDVLNLSREMGCAATFARLCEAVTRGELKPSPRWHDDGWSSPLFDEADALAWLTDEKRHSRELSENL